MTVEPLKFGEDEGRIDFFGTYDTRQGGDSSRYSAWGDVETKSGDTVLRQQVFLIFRDMRLRENFTGFLPVELNDLEKLVRENGVVQKVPVPAGSASR